MTDTEKGKIVASSYLLDFFADSGGNRVTGVLDWFAEDGIAIVLGLDVTEMSHCCNYCRDTVLYVYYVSS